MKSLMSASKYINKRKYGGMFDQSDNSEDDDEAQKAIKSKFTPITRRKIATQ